MVASPYRNTFVQKSVEIVLKGLSALWVLSGDLELMIWTTGLKSHLEKQIEKAKREEEAEKPKPGLKHYW